MHCHGTACSIVEQVENDDIALLFSVIDLYSFQTSYRTYDGRRTEL